MKVNYLSVWIVIIGVVLGFTSCMDDPDEVVPTYTYVCDIQEYANGYILETDWNDVLFASSLPAGYEGFESGMRAIATFTDLVEVGGELYGYTVTLNELSDVNTKEIVDITGSEQKDTLGTDLLTIYSSASANKYLNITFDYYGSEKFYMNHEFYIVYDEEAQDEDGNLIFSMHHNAKDDADTGSGSLINYRGLLSFDFRSFEVAMEKPYDIFLYYTPIEGTEQKLIINVPDLDAATTGL